jgi:hypothetical protein
VIPFFKYGRRAEDGMYMSTLPLAIRSTDLDGDHKLLPEDFGLDGAAWTAAVALGRPDDHSCPRLRYYIHAESSSSSVGLTTKVGLASLRSIVGRITDLKLSLTLTEKSHAPTFPNNTTQWPAHLLFREKVEGRPFHIQRDITTPFLPRDITLQKMVRRRKV